ncbi:MAG: hypothetical protein GY865_14750 [candidate division Zixibacteria bacterium]|nr:hypothetical protein [candidate division Zixibacteria bacterium]
MKYPRKRLKKDGKHVIPSGLKLARRQKFETTIPAGKVKVRSKYEKRTVKYLEKNNIKYQYEPLILLDGRQYRPDFFLPEYNLFLEICGYGHMPFYSDRVAFKEEMYKKNRLKAVFIHYNGKGSLEKLIKIELEKFGIPFSEG